MTQTNEAILKDKDAHIEHLTTLLTTTKADWLRSEIEKLEGMKKPISELDLEVNDIGELQKNSYNHALTSIITRYKEELLELKNK